MYPEKTFRPDNLRLPFPTDREAPQVARCDNSKKYSSRLPSAFGQFSAKSLASLRRCSSKKRSCRRAFSFGSILCKKTLQRPAAMTRKRAASDSLRLLVDTLQKASPAFGNVPRKNVETRLPSAFGQSSTKSPASLRKCTPKRRSGQTTSGCLFPPIVRLPKRPAAITRKSTAPDCLQLWGDPLRKATPAFGNVPQPFASGCRL